VFSLSIYSEFIFAGEIILHKLAFTKKIMKKILLSVIAIGYFSIGVAQHTCISPATNYTINNDARDMVKNDFNGDGFMDVATANPNNNNVCVLRGNGTGGFAPVDSFAVNSFYPQGLTSGDFNGDGKPDIATANNSGNNISVLLNVGAGSFSTAVTYSTSASSPAAITSTDFNGDGFPDLATANNVSGDVSIFLGNGTGSFVAASNYTAGSGPWYILSGDFNNDTKADIAIVNQQGNNISILINSGTGTFSAPTNYTVGIDPRRICAADFNSDGNIDLAVSSYGASDVSVLIGTGTGTFNAAVSYPAGGGLYVVTSADMNGDGKLDMAVGDATLSRIYVFEGFGNGTFDTPIMFQLTTSSVYGLVAADFDMDTHMDLAIACSNSNYVSVFLNNPSFALSIAGQSASCSGDMITLTGAGAATYTWSANAGGVNTYTAMISPTVNTTYTLQGTNGLCNASDTFQLIVNPLPSVTTSWSGIPCYGMCVGSDSAVCATGVSYLWQPGGQTTAGIHNLCAGNYSVTVTDANGCASTVWTPINQPPALVVTFTNIVNATCSGITNGSVDGNPTGGTPGYTYSWSNGATSQTNSGLGAGNYTLIVTDAGSCTATGTVTISNSIAAPTATITGVSSSCQGQPITFTGVGSGGSAPYSYNWIDKQLAASVGTNTTCTVAPTTCGYDTVTFQVIDYNGCVGDTTQSVFINYADSLSGYVVDTAGNPVTAGSVYLFQDKSTHVGLGDTIAITNIHPNGYYQFPNVFYGDYRIKFIADTTIYHTAIPNYYSTKPNAFQWDSAVVIHHNTCTATNIGGYNDTLIQLPASTTGPGIISGYVTPGAGYGQRSGHNSTLGAPLKGVDIKLGKNPGGNAAARTSTDVNGYYSFTNVPVGNYRIFVDIPNYGMDSVLIVSITPTVTTSNNNNYYVDSTMIRVDTAFGIGIKTNTSVNSNTLFVYPNPATNFVTIKSVKELGTIILINSLGQTVYKESTSNIQQRIDIGHLPAGIYVLHVQDKFVRLIKD
jgi:hypothetical protein